MVMNAEMKYKTKSFNFAAYHNLETVRMLTSEKIHYIIHFKPKQNI